jgi:SAM-dependent methyltransferase
VDHLTDELKKLSVRVTEITVSHKDYTEFLSEANYSERYPNYYPYNIFEKTFEHFLVYNLTNMGIGENFLDIASENSPLAEILGRLTGCTSFSQDLTYDKGIHGQRIGSDASDIPVGNNSFHYIAATCSIEHFENESDIGFMREMARILRPGGILIVVPLYMNLFQSAITDPIHAVGGKVVFDKDAAIYAIRQWQNRHGRMYSPKSLFERLMKPNPGLHFTVAVIQNPHSIDNSVYARFVLTATKA